MSWITWRFVDGDVDGNNDDVDDNDDGDDDDGDDGNYLLLSLH